jgi:hypothetical protein
MNMGYLESDATPPIVVENYQMPPRQYRFSAGAVGVRNEVQKRAWVQEFRDHGLHIRSTSGYLSYLPHPLHITSFQFEY